MTSPKSTKLPLSRRGTLAGMAGSLVLAALPGRGAAVPVSANGLFRHGVASGDPDAVSVVLWTRVTPAGTGAAEMGAAEVEWELAADRDFARILRHGRADAGPEQDHTVKVLAEGLAPGGRYFYRFRCGGVTSPIGQTRTLPEGRLDRLGIALASCSNYAFGFFNAYDAIARDPGVEYVLHTGDYIYEYGADGWGAETARRLGRVHQPANEIVSLSDYRQRHAQYKTDAGAQAMHAAHPLLACWDDHESANNPWIGGAQNHQDDKEGTWEERRAASIRAYFEWMPVREPGMGRSRAQFWRSYRFGDLATLHTLETRHTGRAKQIDYQDHAKAITSQAEADAMVRDVIGAPGRAMLSPELEADLAAALRRSVSDAQPWRLIGNPMPIARTRVPDVVGMGLLPDPTGPAGGSDAAKVLAWKGKWNLPFYTDTWDGYDWARERLYDLARAAGASDLVFLTGDSHSFWANRLADAAGRPAGLEIGTAGISSPGDFADSGFGAALGRKLDKAFADHNPEVVWTDNAHQGYVRLDLRRHGGQAVVVAVDTVLRRDYRAFVLKRFAIRSKAGTLEMTEAKA